MASTITPDSRQRYNLRSEYYVDDVNFAELAEQDEDFRALFKASKYRLDFQDPNTLQRLTQSLLRRDFNLQLALPDDRLCPPVPVRWNYVHWIQELLDTSSEDYTECFDVEREVLGLDIGVGASCIYALLACASRPRWRMLGSDVDAHSLDFAKKNVKLNGLDDRIRLKLTNTTEALIPLDAMGVEELDFLMVNPPFFTSEVDMMSTYAKTRPPHAVCTGSPNEMICEGGDVGFVMRIFEESLKLRERVQWYTAMLGKLASAQQLVAELKKQSVTNFAVTNLAAGQKTRRWAVAWSFRDYRPSNAVARHGELVLALLPLATEQTIDAPLFSTASLGEKIDATLKSLDVRWRWRPERGIGVMECMENVWSRAARRRRQFGPSKDESKETRESEKQQPRERSDSDHETVALAVKIICSDESAVVRWLRGSEQLIWTSFCGMLKRTVTGRV